jgi:hypothetical protein
MINAHKQRLIPRRNVGSLSTRANETGIADKAKIHLPDLARLNGRYMHTHAVRTSNPLNLLSGGIIPGILQARKLKAVKKKTTLIKCPN